MIVEFFGLPGTGKTTYLNMLMARYPQQTVQFFMAKRMLTAAHLPMLFSREWVSFFTKLLALWLGKRRKVKYDFRVLYDFCRMYLRYMELRGAPGDTVYLSDHGLVQCISSLVWDDPRGVTLAQPMLRQIGTYFGQSVQFFCLTEPDDARLDQRMRERRFEVRLKHFAEADAFRVLDAQRVLFDAAAETLQTKDGIPVLDGASSLDENFRKICALLQIQE